MSGSNPRVIYPGEPVGLAPRGRTAANLALNFPAKCAGESLDYVADFWIKMADTGETTIASFTVTVLPAGPTVSNQSMNGTQAIFWLSGGVPGSQYLICVTATTTAGRVMQGNSNLFITPDEGAAAGQSRNAFYVGDDFSKTFALGNTNAGGLPAAIDLTGCGVQFRLVPEAGGAAALNFSLNDGTGVVTVPTPANGMVVVDAPGATYTAELAPGCYNVLITVTYSTGSVKTYAVNRYEILAAG